MRVTDFDQERPELLAEFLGSRRAPSAMPPLALDGYLTGILLAPQLIRPSTWLELVWGEEPPQFETIEQANSVTGAIMARYNSINRRLNIELGGDPQNFELPFEDDDLDAAAEWAEGFTHALMAEPAAWQMLERKEGAAILLTPIIILTTSEDDVDELFGDDTEQLAEILDRAAQHLRMMILGLSALKLAARTGQLDEVNLFEPVPGKRAHTRKAARRSRRPAARG